MTGIKGTKGTKGTVTLIGSRYLTRACAVRSR
jgi:hypothetical protein